MASSASWCATSSHTGEYPDWFALNTKGSEMMAEAASKTKKVCIIAYSGELEPT